MNAVIRPALQNCPDAQTFLREAIKLAGTNPNEFAVNTAIPRGRVYSWTRGVDFSGPEIAVIAKELKLHENEKHALTLLRFPMLDEEKLRQLPKRNQAGALLRTYRELAGLSQPQLGKKLGIGTTNNFSLWETGVQTIPKDRADSFIQVLCELLKENPYFNVELFKQAIDDSRLKMGRPTIELGSTLPASHALCDAADEVDFLKDAMHRKEIDVGALAAAIHVEKDTVSAWVRRRVRIDESKLLAISTALTLGDDERDHFVGVCLPALAADAHPKAGALLKAYREMAGMTQAALSKKLGCSEAQMSAYESGAVVIPNNAVRTILHELTPPLKDNPYFKPNMFKELVNKSQPKKEHKKPIIQSVRVVPMVAATNLNGERDR
jgi:transcriptional regulator with XRE-family HTH domain